MAPRTASPPNPGESGPDPTTAREEIVAAVRRLFAHEPGWTQRFLARTGLENGRPRTLQYLADRAPEFGFPRPVTREWFRRVLDPAEEYLRAKAPTLPWPRFREAARAAHSRLPLPLDEFLAGFGYREFSPPRKLFQSLETFAGSCALPFDFRLDIRQRREVSVRAADEERLVATLQRLRQVVGSAYGEVEPVAAELGCSARSLVRLVTTVSDWEFLDEEQRYFWRRPKLPPPRFAVTGNQVLTVLCAVFAGVERAESADLERSVCRHQALRHLRNRPVPARVIELIAARSGLFEVRNGQIRRGRGWTWRRLNERNRALVGICARLGRVVSSRTLSAELVRSGQRKEHAWLAMTVSPFLIYLRPEVFRKDGRYRFVMEPEDIDPVSVANTGAART